MATIIETTDADFGSTTSYSFLEGDNFQGSISPLDTRDTISATLVAGQTYTISLTGYGPTDILDLGYQYGSYSQYGAIGTGYTSTGSVDSYATDTANGTLTMTFTAQHSGEYYFTVFSTTATLSYNMIFGPLAPPPPGPTMGDDKLFGTAVDDFIDLLDGNDVYRAGTGNDTVFGGAGDDNIHGNEGFDFLEGGDGDDTIQGHDDDDTIAGEGGEDQLYGGLGNDDINGGDGRDQLFGEDGDDVIYGGDGNDKALGGDGNDFIHGGAQNDRLYGEKGRDTLLGGEGNDQLYGGSKDDRLFGETGNDLIGGGGGDDYIDGGAGHDKLSGNNGADTLLGDQGNDQIGGGKGDDLLSGGAGNDTLTGGKGADTFEFHVGGQHDHITDFESTIDQIDLTSFGLTALGDVTVDDGSGSLVIGFLGGETLTLDGLLLSDVVASDFLI